MCSYLIVFCWKDEGDARCGEIRKVVMPVGQSELLWQGGFVIVLRRPAMPTNVTEAQEQGGMIFE